MILAIDIGNTRIKSAVFEKDMLLELHVFKKEDFLLEIEKILKKHQTIHVLVVSSVGSLGKSDFEKLSHRVKIHFISRDQLFPFINKYESPQTLGIDRMVLVAGAVLKYPEQNVLIIDAGTCVTYDVVDASKAYFGGAISPGLRLRYEAMHQYTSKLPLLAKEEPENLIGNTTNQSMHSGVVNGLTFEIDGYITALTTQKENFIIILTGGDANFLAVRLKNTIFANSNFLLESLNELYQYQIKND